MLLLQTPPAYFGLQRLCDKYSREVKGVLVEAQS